MPRSRGTHDGFSPECAGCPLQSKRSNPITAKLKSVTTSQAPQCTVVCEYPGPQDKLADSPLQGPAGLRVRQELKARGITHYNAIFRIGCYPNTVAKRLDSSLIAAAKHCRSRFDAAFKAANSGGKLPALWLGKHSANGVLSAYDAKCCKEMPHNGNVKLDHPRIAFFHAAPMQVPWLAGLDRFAALVHKEDRGKPPTPIIMPDSIMLNALNSLGPVVGWDVETLGVDPLTSPITCIGLSDGKLVISVPWDSYSTKTQGYVHGCADSRAPLRSAIREAVKLVLSSQRTQVTQNGSYDVLAMRARGLPGRNDFDTLHAHKILWPEIPANLEAIGVHLLPNLDRRWKTIFRAGRDDDAKGSDVFRDSNEIDLRNYNALDAWVTAAAYYALSAELAIED